MASCKVGSIQTTSYGQCRSNVSLGHRARARAGDRCSYSVAWETETKGKGQRWRRWTHGQGVWVGDPARLVRSVSAVKPRARLQVTMSVGVQKWRVCRISTSGAFGNFYHTHACLKLNMKAWLDEDNSGDNQLQVQWLQMVYSDTSHYKNTYFLYPVKAHSQQ